MSGSTTFQRVVIYQTRSRSTTTYVVDPLSPGSAVVRQASAVEFPASLHWPSTDDGGSQLTTIPYERQKSGCARSVAWAPGTLMSPSAEEFALSSYWQRNGEVWNAPGEGEAHSSPQYWNSNQLDNGSNTGNEQQKTDVAGEEQAIKVGQDETGEHIWITKRSERDRCETVTATVTLHYHGQLSTKTT